jgi:hypothetical protein
VRYFLAVLLIAAGLLGSCTRPGATGVSVNSAFRPLVPPDTKALAAVDFDKLKASPFYKRHQNDLDLPILNAMSERVGFDPRRDISDLLITWNGSRALVLARGRLNRETLESKLRSLGTQPTRYKSYTLFEEDRETLAFLKHGVAIAGPAEALRSAIDLENNGRGGVTDELQARLATIPKGDQVWAVSRGGLGFTELSMRSDIDSALSNIIGYVNDASLGLGFDAGTHLQAEIVCVSNEGAQRVRDALRGGIGLARLTTRDDESDLLKLYDAIQVSQDQQTIHVKADLSGELTDKLMAYLPQIRNRADQLLQR